MTIDLTTRVDFSTLVAMARFNNFRYRILVTQITDRSLHIVTSDPTCVQNFRPVPLTVCEILDIMYCEVCCCLHVN